MILFEITVNTSPKGKSLICTQFIWVSAFRLDLSWATRALFLTTTAPSRWTEQSNRQRSRSFPKWFGLGALAQSLVLANAQGLVILVVFLMFVWAGQSVLCHCATSHFGWPMPFAKHLATLFCHCDSFAAWPLCAFQIDWSNRVASEYQKFLQTHSSDAA